MKTYKKPISILVEVDAEELMAISQGVELEKPDDNKFIDLGGNISDHPEVTPHSKGYDSWED